MGNIEITTKRSRLKSVSSIEDDYLEATTGGVLKNFVIFTGKHLCWSLSFIKLQACKFIEKRLQHWCFPLHVKKFLRTPILKSISLQLLLIILLVQQLMCFRISLYNYKEKPIFRWRKCSLKLDYATEWRMILRTMSKLLRYTWVKFNVSILNRLKAIFFS